MTDWIVMEMEITLAAVTSSTIPPPAENHAPQPRMVPAVAGRNQSCFLHTPLAIMSEMK